MLTYRNDLPKKEELFDLYEVLDWNRHLDLSPQELIFAMKGSFYTIFAYDDDKLVGTGRIISDGVTNAYMCGVGVHPDYQSHGIGREIINKIAVFCEEHGLHLQFICTEKGKPYYEDVGFTQFGYGMKL